jgi:SAM-dependent methyltransferase
MEMNMEIHDETYDSPEHTWWDDNGDGNLAFLRFINNPTNFDHIDAIVSSRIRKNPDTISILYIGYGTSIFPNRCKNIDLEIIGIEFSTEFEGIAPTPLKQNKILIKQYVGCDDKLPLESDSFDFACCHYPLPCAEELQGLLKEISRVLKKNGLFFMDNTSTSSTSNLIILKILQECKGVALPDPISGKFDLSIGPKGFLKILNDHYLCNRGNDIPSEVNYIFHYFNLRKQPIGKEYNPPFRQLADLLPQPFPHHPGEIQ